MKHGSGSSMQHAPTSAGAAGTTVESTGKTSIRKTITPVFGGKRGGKRATSKRSGGRR